MQTTTSNDAAVLRFSRSTSRRTGSPGGRNIAASAARLSCETIMDLMPQRRAQAPVHRNVVRSDTSSRSGSRSSSSRRSGRRAMIARYPPVPGTLTPGNRDHQPLLGLPAFRPGSRHDQHRLVPGRQVAGTEFPEGGPQPARRPGRCN